MHGLETRGATVDRGRFNEPGRFSRMFPHLRSLTSFKPGPAALGGKTGPMNGGLDAAPSQLNPNLTAGFTFLGQFLDHDITFDPTSSLERQNDPQAIRNFRTPAFELDSLYGGGPDAQPYLYDPAVPGAFALGRGEPFTTAAGEEVPAPDDLLRVPAPAGKTFGATAIIGDPRNDENLVVSQLHLGFMKVHNRILRELGRSLPSAARFAEAQRLTRWHYQWLILNEFLPKTCGKDVVDDILEHGRRFFRFEEEASIPVEFAVAAYRFGHSQVRPGYAVNKHGGARIFPDDPRAEPDPAAPDLRGNRRLSARLKIEWEKFFGPDAQLGMRIDTKLNQRLLDLPETVVPKEPRIDPSTGQPIVNSQGNDIDFAIRSLAERNLQRGLAFSLPSGQAVARFMGLEPLSEDEIWQGVVDGKGPAPLWFYILREAETRGEGQRLHGVGARIVAEVFIGLLQGDLASFVNHEPNWQPEIPTLSGEPFSMLDFLEYGEGTPPTPGGAHAEETAAIPEAVPTDA